MGPTRYRMATPVDGAVAVGALALGTAGTAGAAAPAAGAPA